ncbi:hypothetical protein GTP41_13250 [Pseudoduganella sp. DS3]|uniref:Uncharacterized protein n=1 Tax=Pseudoduganella guangdongensis TaxID=2692179 RepID=A0A6N9HHV6_9BURK|nr:hypothetical protein [Pseudoduganella guangdongensis]MYN03070.1 hypothetical protein [Pseudoduganella guangdongensis]
MSHSFLRAAGTALLPLTLAACAVPAPHADKVLGQSLTDMKNAQVINPAADRNMATASGMPAATAKLGYDQYIKSFKAPEKTNGFTIGLGK